LKLAGPGMPPTSGSIVQRVRTTPPPPIDVLEVRDAHAFAYWRNMLILVWRRETDSSAVRRARHHLIELIKRHPDGVGLMQVALPEAEPPDSDARGAITDMLAAGRGTVACSSVIYGGTGFWMASVRALVAGVAMLARPGFPHQVFATVDEAADWHARLLPAGEGPAPSRFDIKRAADAVVAAVDKRSR